MKSIQMLCAASLLLGACVLSSPATAAAQDSSKQDKVIARANSHIDHQQTDHPVATEPADQHVKQVIQQGTVTRTVRTTRHGRRVVTRTTRARVLCDDGTWSYSNCADHGGLASRQYTPRASEQAVLHANEHSAVARAYANRMRSNAIARCSDGTYWHATNHVRACAGHGGVARWY